MPIDFLKRKRRFRSAHTQAILFTLALHSAGAWALQRLSSNAVRPGTASRPFEFVWVDLEGPRAKSSAVRTKASGLASKNQQNDTAPSQTVSAPPGVDSRKVQLTGSEATTLGRGLSERIEAHLGYPKALAQRGLGGRLLLELELTNSGESVRARVLNPSGYAELDEAALVATRKAAPFTDLTRVYFHRGDETLTIRIPFIFDPNL